MSSHTKRIGDIGQAAVTAKLLTYENIIVSKPVTDNESYDLIVDIDNILYRVQVKTTEHIKNNCMKFATNITNPFQKTSKKYNASEIDLFILYCIENQYYGLVTMNEYTSSEITLRLKMPLNNNYTNVKMAADYSLDKRLQELLKTGQLSNCLLTRAQAHALTLQNNVPTAVSTKMKDFYISCRKTIRPETYAQFQTEMEQLNWNYSAMGRKYGVTDNAIRKWEKHYIKYQNLNQ
jgi:hypothetical protein